MRPTLAFVVERFNHFNRLIFKPALPPITLKVGNGRRALGSFKYPLNYPPTKERGRGECSITISQAYDRPQAEIEDVIIHEMIHYCVWLNHVVEPSHGPEFRRLMDAINRAYGRSITITEHLDDQTRQTDTRARIHCIVATTMPDGSKAFACFAKTAAGQIKRTLEANGFKLSWYVSTDPFFNRYPTVRTPKLFPISDADFTTHILPSHPIT